MNPEAVTGDLTGRTLGRYQIVTKLGAGGMGEVYRARDTRLKRDVALKVLPTRWMAEPERRRRFEQEARAASALNNPNIVTIFDIDQIQGVDVIAMEYVPGKTLDQLIPRRGLPMPDVLKCAIEITGALAAAHGAGIVHRDIKPSNIMIADAGQVKVLDFGLAKLAEPAGGTEDAPTVTVNPHTDEGIIVGTVSYMSPEQAQGKPVDARSDIFSFGSMLYEMVTGQKPFQGESKVSTLAAIVAQEPAPLARIVPPDLEKIITRCLRKDPSRRFQTMADLKVALAELKEEIDSGKLEGVRPVPPSRGRSLLFAGAAVGVAVTAGLAWWLHPASAPEKRQRVMTRLTTDGRSALFDVSPDGKLMAYVLYETGKYSNSWVRQVSGGTPIQVTDEPDGISSFVFSPDGNHAAYSRAKDEKIYEISTLGGEGRLLAGDGLVAGYLSNGEELLVSKVDRTAAKAEWFALSIRSGERRRLLPPDLQLISLALSPDGNHMIAFTGYQSTYQEDLKHWSLISLGDGSVAKTAAPVTMDTQTYAPFPCSWVKDPEDPRRQWVIYQGPSGDSFNIFRSPIDHQGRIGRDVERLTFTPGTSYGPAVSMNGIMLFNSGTLSRYLVKVPIDANAVKVRGERERLTQDEGVSYNGGSMSADGRKLAYYKADYKADMQVYVRDLPSGREIKLAEGYWAVISPDGSTVVFSRPEAGSMGGVYVVSAEGGAPRRVKVTNPEFAVKDISADNRYAMCQDWDRASSIDRISRLDLQTGELKTVLSHPKNSLWHPHFAPDQRWMMFKMQLEPERHQLFITPVAGDLPAGSDKWIPLTTGQYWDDKPTLSPDGNVLYFTSNRDAYYCIWAQKLDRVTKHPVGGPLAIQHFHSERQIPYGQQPQTSMELSVAKDMLVTLISDVHTDIWMMDLKNRK